MQAIVALRQARVPGWHEISPAPLRFIVFLFVGMPTVFMSLIYLSAYLMQICADWTHERSLHFMASAFTGGAIVLPHEPPHRTMTKVLAAILGAAGVGMFGFLVAALLDSGMVDPIINVCRLKLATSKPGKFEKGVHIFVSFIKVALFVVSLNFLASILFAWIMRLSEGWGWFQAVKSMISVGLGGGVVYRDMGIPHTNHGTFLFCTVSCWAIGTAALMIATAAEAFMDNTADFEASLAASLRSRRSVAEDDFKEAEEAGTSSKVSRSGTFLERAGTASIDMTRSQILAASRRIGISEEDYRILRLFGVFVLVWLPIALLVVMLFVASCMSAMTNWEFTNAFWTALPAVTGGACTLTQNTNPQLTYWGAFIMFFASSVGFLALNIAMGVGAKFIGPFIADRPYLDKEKGIGFAIFALFVICWVLIPITVFTLSVPLGAVMAVLEGWRFVDGFWWCVSVQCGGGMALTDATIQHTGGMWIASVAVAWSIGISIVSIGLSGAPVVGPLMSAIGMDMKDELLHLIPKRVTHVARATYNEVHDDFIYMRDAARSPPTSPGRKESSPR